LPIDASIHPGKVGLQHVKPGFGVGRQRAVRVSLGLRGRLGAFWYSLGCLRQRERGAVAARMGAGCDFQSDRQAEPGTAISAMPSRPEPAASCSGFGMARGDTNLAVKRVIARAARGVSRLSAGA
jgi:hypothetical protein